MNVVDQDASTITRRVTITSWPESTWLRVEDAERGFLIDQYDAAGPDAGVAGDVSAAYAARAADAIRRSESDHEHLRWLLELRGLLNPDTERVELTVDERRRFTLAQLLDAHNLTVAALEPQRLPETIELLEARPLEHLYTLLCAWIETVEPHVGAQRPSESWFRDAPPDKHCYYRSKVGYPAIGRWVAGQDLPAPPELRERAYQAFLDDVDVPLERFHFGVLLRSIFFSRSEFPDRPLHLPKALYAICDPSR
jgi:hypothetical protein